MSGPIRKAIAHARVTSGLLAALLPLSMVAGCAVPQASVPRNGAAYEELKSHMPASAEEAAILPADKLNVQVLYEPDLSRDQLRVDSAGNVDLPLVGQVKASGLTAHQLADSIQLKLGQYLNSPHVDVSVINAAGEHVIVEGNVNDPGVYEIAGSASLLEVIARAKSPNRTAALNQIVVFREVDGQRMAAVFDLNRIRRGVDRDPRLIAGDTVVVGFSALKGAYRDFLQVAPALAIFRPY